jgi:hypothetical protein
MRPGVTLQINLAPTDLPHARWILPHQLRCWAAQVSAVVLTVDLHRSRNRYAAEWRQRLPGLRTLIEEICGQHAEISTHDVDYSPAARRRVADMFFGGMQIPAKDWFGAPFYAYFDGLARTTTRYVFHMDSDMLYGGGSQTWVSEACALLRERTDTLACEPLAGPPVHPRSLERDCGTDIHRNDHLSTRLFLVDMERLRSLAPLPLMRPDWWRWLEARVDGHPPFETAEGTISHAMVVRGMVRLNFLGRGPGAWSLHPPFRSALFYARLPELIERVEKGDIPEEQCGHYDMNDSMIDWSSARQPLWRKVMRHARLAVTGPLSPRHRADDGTPLSSETPSN